MTRALALTAALVALASCARDKAVAPQPAACRADVGEGVGVWRRMMLSPMAGHVEEDAAEDRCIAYTDRSLSVVAVEGSLAAVRYYGPSRAVKHDECANGGTFFLSVCEFNELTRDQNAREADLAKLRRDR